MNDSLSEISTVALEACAAEAARTAGTHAIQNSSRRTEAVYRSSHDVKLQLDIECQKIAELVISKHFPDHAFLGEESASDNEETNQGYQWIVDPIDGTVNFSHGLPYWCSSVAVRLKEEVVAGAVFAPVFNEMFTARIDGPALCNGEIITVSSNDLLKDSIVLTGTDRKFDANAAPLAILKSIAVSVQRTRVMGAAALDLCQVAAGRAEGYFEGEIYIWDIAAGGLIVRRAGGTTEMLKPPDTKWKMAYLASNRKVHQELKSAIEPAL